MEGEADPAWFFCEVAGVDFVGDALGIFLGDVQQVVAVGACAGAAAAYLDAVAVVEEFDGEVVVQVGDVEGHDADAVAVLAGEDVQIGDGVKGGEGFF